MFRLRWSRKAEDRLAEFWLQADSSLRQAITTACHGLEQRLGVDPHNEGESRSKGRRIAFEPPLGVLYRVEPDGQTVSILQVLLLKPRRQ
jgi:plasmid stabilization system protein ParE